MTAAELLAQFEKRGHTYIYHACTVRTFQSYCTTGAYISRASVTRAGLPLTAQYSDDVDHERDIFDCLFLNVYDQHADVTDDGRPVFGLNKFGPVLMAFSVNALTVNVDGWKSYRHEIAAAEYDEAIHEIDDIDDFVSETFRYTAPHAWSDEPSRRPQTRGPASTLFAPDLGGGIPLATHLRRVVLDSLPPNHHDLEREARNSVLEALRQAGLPTNVAQRICVPRCGCKLAYGGLTDEQVRRFFYEDTVEVYSLRLPRVAD